MSVKVVLVIDDDKRTRDSLRMFFELEGFIVTCYESMLSACESLKQVRFDLVLIDYHMPEINGADVTRMMRDFCQDTFLVGMSLENRKQEFIEAGADAFISKGRLIQDLLLLIYTRSFKATGNKLRRAKLSRFTSRP